MCFLTVAGENRGSLKLRKPVKSSSAGSEISAFLPNIPDLQTYLVLLDFLLLLQRRIGCSGGNASTLINQILILLCNWGHAFNIICCYDEFEAKTNLEQ